MTRNNGTILYRVHRLGFFFGALFFLPITGGIAILTYFSAISGYRGQTLYAFLIIVLCFYIDYIFLMKLIFPPEIEISTCGIRLYDRSWFVSGTYAWNEIDGPQQGNNTNGALLEMVVKADGKSIRMPPGHFGVTYAEMAAMISSARSGHLLDPKQWRIDHPQHPLRKSIKIWIISLIVNVIIFFILKLMHLIK